MLLFPIVENLDVFKSGRLDLGVRGVANAMRPFILEAVELAPLPAGRSVPAGSRRLRATMHTVCGLTCPSAAQPPLPGRSPRP